IITQINLIVFNVTQTFRIVKRNFLGGFSIPGFAGTAAYIMDYGNIILKVELLRRYMRGRIAVRFKKFVLHLRENRSIIGTESEVVRRD
ncbi:MAG: hypothetical protein LBN00_05385, partial [Oscillospiraceae bacterium]|nr:hypothetical protein [Oscillospiraceae bacterium]